MKGLLGGSRLGLVAVLLAISASASADGWFPETGAFAETVGRFQAGDYDRAEQAAARALVELPKLPRHRLALARTHTILAAIARTRGAYPLAEKEFRTALQVLDYKASDAAEEQARSAELGATENQFGVVLVESGKRTEGIGYMVRSLDRLTGERSFPIAAAHVAQELTNEAEILRRQGELDASEREAARAVALLVRALKTEGARTADLGLARRTLGGAYLYMGKVDDAVQAIRQSIGELEPANRPHAQIDLAGALTVARRFEEAKKQRTAALRASEGAGGLTFNMLQASARQSLAAHDTKGAFELAAATISLMEREIAQAEAFPEERALAFVRKVVDPTTALLVSLNVDHGLADPTSTRRGLAHVLRHKRMIRKSFQPTSVPAKPERALQGDPTGIVEMVEARLAPDTALIEIVAYWAFAAEPDMNGSAKLATPRYAAYRLQPGRPVQVIDLGALAAIDGVVRDLRAAMSSPATTDTKYKQPPTATKLAAAIGKLAGDARHVIIAPDGYLDLVPFEALRDLKGRFLIEAHEITYLASGRDLLDLPDGFDGSFKSGAAVIAAPAYDATPKSQDQKQAITAETDQPPRTTYQPAGYMLTEGDAVARLLGAETTLCREEATKSAFLGLRGPEILHVSTHGKFYALKKVSVSTRFGNLQVDESPADRQELALAGANRDPSNGVVTAEDVSRMSLVGTKLAVFSACETGLGTPVEMSIFGFRRALAAAGAQSSLLSLWEVDGPTTRDFMVDLYTGRQLGLGRALRETKLSFLSKKWRHPYYWAPFILSGRWDSLPLRDRPSKVKACSEQPAQVGVEPSLMLIDRRKGSHVETTSCVMKEARPGDHRSGHVEMLAMVSGCTPVGPLRVTVKTSASGAPSLLFNNAIDVVWKGPDGAELTFDFPLGGTKMSDLVVSASAKCSDLLKVAEGRIPCETR